MSTSGDSIEVTWSQPRPAIRVLVILVGLGVLVAGAVWVACPPAYRAEAKLQMISPSPRIPMQLVQPSVSQETMDRWIRDQAVFVRNESVLREALADPAIMATSWYRGQKDKIESLEKLKDDLIAAPIPDSTYLSVSFFSRDPKDAAVIVNTVVDKYMARVQSAPQLEYGEEMRRYTEQEKRLGDALKDMRHAKERFLQERLGTPGLTQGVNIVGEQLAALAAAITQLNQEKLRAKAVYENLRQADASRLAISPDMLRAIGQDPEVAGLRDLKLSLEIELESAAEMQPASRPAGDRLHNKMKVVERKLDELMARKEKELREYQVTAAHTAMLNAMHEELALREQQVEVEGKLRDLDQGMLEYQGIDEQQELLERQLAQIREHINRLKLLLQDRTPGQVRRVGVAMPPEALDTRFQASVSLIAIGIPIVYGVLLLLVRLVRGPRRVAMSSTVASVSLQQRLDPTEPLPDNQPVS